MKWSLADLLPCRSLRCDVFEGSGRRHCLVHVDVKSNETVL